MPRMGSAAESCMIVFGRHRIPAGLCGQQGTCHRKLRGRRRARRKCVCNLAEKRVGNFPSREEGCFREMLRNEHRFGKPPRWAPRKATIQASFDQTYDARSARAFPERRDYFSPPSLDNKQYFPLIYSHTSSFTLSPSTVSAILPRCGVPRISDSVNFFA
jgi:hypothetical protein